MGAIQCALCSLVKAAPNSQPAWRAAELAVQTIATSPRPDLTIRQALRADLFLPAGGAGPAGWPPDTDTCAGEPIFLASKLGPDKYL